MDLEIKEVDHGFAIFDETGDKRIAEIEYQQTAEDIIVATHTWVDPVLRGEGVAEKLLTRLVEFADEKDIQIKALCPYVVRKFNEEPEKYDFINADK
ncbi:GNAT family N-acetyltransferase [Aerococcus sp. 1KP-2016]|jgi:predicted GNAT family acetyltransferase|uniref:GNAT family N-acetyltransferase n=1 Tax=Aerococcus sp. 1KP-2016 TaxID=1981982 RepID=UPI000B988EC8|nr:GNAT family N-acetyltransferase [Aerococcus sp. 1KP-2016]OYQ65896.1 GNAT family N-acetyltransferase [Aerococcus sp. 1KP-2016]